MIEKIKHYALTAAATMYDEESMSVLQLAGRNAAKTNELVDKVNEFEGRVDEMEDFLSDGGVVVSVNDRIDKMVKSGELATYINDKAMANKADLALVTALANGGPSGVFATLSELEAANVNPNRVYLVGADWYYYNGSSWVRGGTYLTGSVAEKSLTGDSIALNEIVMISGMTFDRTTKLLTFDAPFYFDADDRTYNHGVGVGPTEAKTVDLSNLSETSIYWICLDTSDNSIQVTASSGSWNANYKVILRYYKGEFFGVNEKAIAYIYTDNNPQGFGEVIKSLNRTASRIKFLGDSITAGVGASDYELTSTALGTNPSKFMASQDSECWANRVGKRMKERFAREKVLAPIEPNMTVVGSSVVAFNSSAKSGIQTRFYNKAEFKVKATDFTLWFTHYVDCGIVRVYVDGETYGTYDTYSSVAAYMQPITVSNQLDKVHTVTIELYDVNEAVTAGNPVLRFEGVSYNRPFEYANYGVSGWDAMTVSNNIGALTNEKDDIVVVALGTNDRLRASEDVYRHSMKLIINKIIEQGSKALVITPTPQVDESVGTYNFSVSDAVRTCIELCEEMNIPYIDLYAEFMELEFMDAYFEDGLHPNDNGYEIIENIVTRKLAI